MPSQTILITGASGLIGGRLVDALETNGCTVLRAVRREPEHANEVRWDPTKGEIDSSKLTYLDGVVHLAGANIAGKRWTKSYKQEIRDSRVQGTRLISDAIAKLTNRPRVFACASAIGYYGDRGDAVLDETSGPGEEFLPDVCLEWENACQSARDAGIRTVNLRTSMVLDSGGGALASMLPPFKFGLGGVVGSGKQYFSWITLDDAVSAIKLILTTDQFSGPVNLAAPDPVTNREFTKTLGRVLGRPTIFPMPAFAARLAFGEMADGLLLASTRVVPTVLQEHGFVFQHPQLEPALRHVLEPPTAAARPSAPSD